MNVSLISIPTTIIIGVEERKGRREGRCERTTDASDVRQSENVNGKLRYTNGM